ncbi:hypothetical protein [Nocardia sp. NPDC005745]|uniref:hypothetical protein n=1 Tax=Nocardia sp. NPDC005745 TaxID=3157061 RepID=UPI00340CB3AA
MTLPRDRNGNIIPADDWEKICAALFNGASPQRATQIMVTAEINMRQRQAREAQQPEQPGGALRDEAEDRRINAVVDKFRSEAQQRRIEAARAGRRKVLARKRSA